MSQYLILDTDTCIYWLNGKEKVQQKVSQLGTDHLRTTIVTFAELRYGAYKSQRVAEKPAQN
jgi:tRNA(fMet)-specific endonuclease VapC